MSDVKEINAETGEEIIRPSSAEEIAQNEADLKAVDDAENLRAAALAKLTKLGLTIDDLEALGLA